MILPVLLRSSQLGSFLVGDVQPEDVKEGGCLHAGAGGCGTADHCHVDVEYRPGRHACGAGRVPKPRWQSEFSPAGAQELGPGREEETAPDVGTLLYIGHNPAAAGLVGLLTQTEADLPTAAIAVIAIAGDWADLAPGGGELLASWAPRTGEARG